MREVRIAIPAMVAAIVEELDYDIYKEMYKYDDPDQLPYIRRLEKIAAEYIKEGLNV